VPLTPPRKRDYALVPAVGIGSVAALTIILGSRYLRPPLYLATWFEFLVTLATFFCTSTVVYHWRVWRREQDPTAYTVRSASAWSLEDDWRHVVRLWLTGLLLGGGILALLRLLYAAGWLRFAWPK
jgi:hypothetical protein